MGAEFPVLKTGPHVCFSINPRKGNASGFFHTGFICHGRRGGGKEKPKKAEKRKIDRRRPPTVFPSFAHILHLAWIG